MNHTFKTRISVLHEWPELLQSEEHPLYRESNADATVASMTMQKKRRYTHVTHLKKVK